MGVACAVEHTFRPLTPLAAADLSWPLGLKVNGGVMEKWGKMSWSEMVNPWCSAGLLADSAVTALQP